MVAQISNWKEVQQLLNKHEGGLIKLRNGLQIKTPDGFGTTVVPELVFHNPYGQPPRSGIVIDIGGHVGVFAMLFAWKNPGVRIFCVEPNPENGKFLTENMKQNGLQDRVTLLPYGIAAKKEKRELYLRESPHSSFDKRADDKNVLSIQCMSINDIFAEQAIDRCEVLKLDCEGAEYEALYALTPETAGKIQKIVMEYHDDLKNDKNTLKSLTSHLEQFGFKLTRQHVAGLHGGGGEIGTAWLEQVK